MNEQKLLPCPFCNGEAKHISCYRVACKKCGIRTVGKGSQFRAQEDWNTRAQQGDYHEGLNEGIKIGRKDIDDIVTQLNCLITKTIEYTKREECSIEFTGLYPELLDIKAKVQMLEHLPQQYKKDNNL